MRHSLMVPVVLMGMLAGFASEAWAKASAAEGTMDGAPSVVLENEFLKLTFIPSRGGECAECLFKPANKSFVTRRVGTLVGNRVWNYADDALYMQWQKMPWNSEVQRREGEVTLVLRAAGKENFTRATTFERRITLRDGEAMARIGYTFSVGQELMAPAKIGLWFFNMPRVVGEPTTYSFPLDTGVKTYDPMTSGGHDAWLYNPARGWVAAVGKSGAGLCFNMEFRRLLCFYSWFSQDSTLEWAFRTMEIKNGDSFSTESLLIPFSGIQAVHGSGGGIVAGFDAPDRCTADEAQAGVKLRALLTSGVEQSGELAVSLQPLPGGETVAVARSEMKLTPGETKEAAFTAKPPREGTWLLVGRFLRDGQEVMDFIKPILVGKTDTPVRIEPKEKRLGNVAERFEDRTPIAGAGPKDYELSMDVESPHVPWAKPYRGGKLRVLVVTDCISGREGVELAERLDMETLWVTAGTQYELNQLGYIFGDENSYRVEHMNASIKRFLAGPCDAIIIGGISADVFSDEVVELLRQKVAAGAGLVFVTPVRGSDKLYSLLPVEKETTLNGRDGKWSAAQLHYITTGVPLAELPNTNYAQYKAKGDPLAAIASGNEAAQPLIVAQEGPGKGRVVVFTYNTSWTGPGNYSGGMTPWVEGDTCKFKYWEYYFSLLAKSLIWSAHREQPAVLKSITTDLGDKPELLLALDNAGDAIPAKAELTISDAFGKPERQASSDAPIAQGEGTIRLSLPADLPGGRHFADVILKDQAGKVITWGSATYRTPEAVKITKVAFDKRAYDPGETAKATVSFRPGDRPPASVLFRGEFTDSLGRLVARAEQRVDDLNKAPLTLNLPVGNPVATAATLRVVAWVEGRPASVGEAQVITLPERFVRRDWGDDWHASVWGNPAGAYVREYLAPVYAKAYHDYGISSVLSSANWQNAREFEWAVRAGFQIMPMSVSYGYINVGHSPIAGKMSYEDQQRKYQETHDKQYLIRPVCLNSPKDLEPLAKLLRELAEYCGWLEPIGYNLGDEMSIGYYVTPFDYDFHPDSLAEFRKWLKERYGALDALNKEWGAQFAAWDAVMPMTALEVKERGNYAPWADHREFMDVTFARFFEWVRARLREKDPRAGVGLSGSQAAEAYGGYDWSRLPKSLDFLQNYSHQNTIIMQRCFGPDVPRAPWYGYGSRNPGMRNTLWWYLLNGCMGGSYFSGPNMFKADLQLPPCTADAAPLVAEFQRGLAKLLRHSQRVSDIALHYSHPSIRAAFITGADGVFRDNRAGWVSAMEDLGYQCDFLSTAQLEAGELAKRNYRAFILPCSVAISSGEAAALRKYVEDGGLLIADSKTGLMDEHCKPRPAGLLDDLFGISRDKPDPMAAAREGDAHFTRDRGPCKLSGLELDVNLAEPDLKLSQGEALGAHSQAPVAIVRNVGKGTAVFLNFLMQSYPQRRELGIEAVMRRIPENLLRLNGAEPAVKVEPVGNPRTHMFTVRYTDGEALIVGSLREAEEKQADTPVAVNFTFPREGFIYDLMQGKSLGRGNSAVASLAPGDAALFAVVPCEVKGLTVAPRAASVAAGAPVPFEVTVQQAAANAVAHVILVEIIGPDGKPRPHYSIKLVTRDGKAAGEFPTALNDPAGQWTIRATDFVSRLTGEGKLEIRE